jgi:hypothetical protein
MSLSGILERWRKRRLERSIQKYKKSIKNKFGFGDDRQRAIEFFQKLGGLQGCIGLLERFMVNIDQSIRDEEEKEQVFKILVGMGGDVVSAIEEYIHRKDSTRVPITWPLKVLDAVAKPEEVVSVIVRALEKLGVSYTTDPERKVLLISQLAEYDDPRGTQALVPFLRDHRDEVQLEAVSALTKKADDASRDVVLQILIDTDTPPRLRAAIVESIQRLGWDVKGYRKKVEAVLPDGMFVDRSGRIKGRTAGSGLDVGHE